MLRSIPDPYSVDQNSSDPDQERRKFGLAVRLKMRYFHVKPTLTKLLIGLTSLTPHLLGKELDVQEKS